MEIRECTLEELPESFCLVLFLRTRVLWVIGEHVGLAAGEVDIEELVVLVNEGGLT